MPVLIIGPKSKIYGGWIRKDSIRYKNKVLGGYVRTIKQFGRVEVTTHYMGRQVNGYDWVWLARRNSLTVKIPDNYITPIEENVLEECKKLQKSLK